MQWLVLLNDLVGCERGVGGWFAMSGAKERHRTVSEEWVPCLACLLPLCCLVGLVKRDGSFCGFGVWFGSVKGGFRGLVWSYVRGKRRNCRDQFVRHAPIGLA